MRPAQRGEKRRLAELARQNAELALEQDVVDAERKRARRIEALEELRECLNLESLPLRIECFDISNIQAESPVGSMVVFADAMPKKAHYRKFGIREAEGPDDFAMMAEVVSRRFARLRPATDLAEYDESFAATPEPRRDRRRQGPARRGARGHAGVRPAARRRDRARQARGGGRSCPAGRIRCGSSRARPGLQLLQRVRDEAHRFALGFHRQRRSARSHESILDALPGVGPARKRALMQHFGSPERLLAASPEELEGVPGVPATTGRRIYAALHKAGGG